MSVTPAIFVMLENTAMIATWQRVLRAPLGGMLQTSALTSAALPVDVEDLVIRPHLLMLQLVALALLVDLVKILVWNLKSQTQMVLYHARHVQKVDGRQLLA